MSRLSPSLAPTNAVDALTGTNKIDDLYSWISRQDGIVTGAPAVVEGSGGTSTKVVTASALDYLIGGRKYHVATAAAAALSGATDDIPENKFGAWRIELAADGTLTTTHGVASGDMSFDDIPDAMMNLASQPRTANTIDVGYLIIEAASGGFTIGTDDPKTGDAAVTAATYIDVIGRKGDNGLNAALGAVTLLSDGVTTLDIDTVDADINATVKAQIAGAGTQAMDDADTVAVDKWGGWLLIVDHAGSGTYALAADGVAGSVSAMTYASKAAVDTALDLVQDRLPMTMCPVSRLYFENTNDGTTPATWTAGTDDWDDAVIVAANAGSVSDYGIVHDSANAKTFSAVRPAIDYTALLADVLSLHTDLSTIVNGALTP